MCKHIQVDVNKHLFLLEHAFVQSSVAVAGGARMAVPSVCYVDHIQGLDWLHVCVLYPLK